MFSRVAKFGVVISMSLLAALATPRAEAYLADANGDYLRNMDDAWDILKERAGMADPIANPFDADVNFDGAVDIRDAMIIGQVVSEIAAPVVHGVRSSIHADTDWGNSYEVNSLVTIKVWERFASKDIASGTVRITSEKTGHDSGEQALTAKDDGSYFFYNWNTVGLARADDYKIQATLTNSAGVTAGLSDLAIALKQNPPLNDQFVSATDISFPGRGISTKFARTYDVTAKYNGVLGFGWTHSYNVFLWEAEDGLVTIMTQNGKGAYYMPAEDGSYRPTRPFDYSTFVKNKDGSYLWSTKDRLNYIFNQGGKLTEIRDPNDNRVKLVYDDAGHLASVADPSGQTTIFAYDAKGRIESVSDPAGRITKYSYDGEDNLISVTDPADRVTIYDYDSTHNLKTVTSPGGNHTYFTVDDKTDRLMGVSGNDGAGKMTYSYNDDAGQYSVTDAIGNTAIYTYDNNGAITEVRDPNGNITRSAYDSHVNLTGATDANGHTTAFTYDDRGNLTSKTDANGKTTTFVYGTDGAQAANVLRRIYNLVIPNVFATVFSFDKDLLVKIIDPMQRETSFDYDGSGNLTKMTYPDGTTETFTYNADGLPTAKTDQKGQTINYVWNAAGNLTKKIYPNKSEVNFTYDQAGNLTGATDSNGAIIFTYDQAGKNIVKVEYPGGETVGYAYDANGNRTQMIYPDGSKVNYSYDNAARLASIKDDGGSLVAGFEYDAANRRTKRTLGNGVTTTYDWQGSDLLTRIVNKKLNGNVLSSFTYTFDGVGNRVSMQTTEGVHNYTYDNTDQLISVAYPNLPHWQGAATAFNYDASGNRDSVTEDGVKKDYTTNDMNQYEKAGDAALRYDANGNLISRTENGQTTTYGYDFDNRLVSVQIAGETISYRYDPFSRRISRTTQSGVTRYIYDGLRVIIEKDGQGAISASYVAGQYFNETLVRMRGGDRIYYTHDFLTSTAELTNVSGDPIESYRYDVYGNPKIFDTTDNQIQTSAVENEYLYTGAQYDDKTRISYFMMRHYDLGLGRFITTDPIGLSGGLNLYRYVENNPANFVDPLGLTTLATICGKNVDLDVDCIFDSITNDQIAEFGVLVLSMFLPYCPSSNKNLPEYSNPYQRRKERMKKKIEEAEKECDKADPTFIQPSREELPLPDRSDLEKHAGLIAKISVPYENSLVKAHVPVFGFAYGEGFKEYRVEYGEGSNPPSWNLIERGESPKVEDVMPADLNSGDRSISGNLATWETGINNYTYGSRRDTDLKGMYTLRLVVADVGGHISEDRAVVTVADIIPNIYGGVAASKDGMAKLTVPEQSLIDDFELISIAEIDDGIYEINPAGEKFSKPATLEMKYERGLLDRIIGRADAKDLGIYVYDQTENRWTYLPTEIDAEKMILSSKIREIAANRAYYAIFEGPRAVGTAPADEKSYTILPDDFVPAEVMKSPDTFTEFSFEDGFGSWTNRDGDEGAELSLVREGCKAGYCLRIAKIKDGGNFASTILNTPFDAKEYSWVQFDYRIGAGVKIDFLAKVNGKWYDVNFTDDPKVYKRLNMEGIGKISNIVADDGWHTAHFNLYEMLSAAPTLEDERDFIVDEVIMADWDTGGYMKLAGGRNRKGAAYYVDDFTITSAHPAGEGNGFVPPDHSREREIIAKTAKMIARDIPASADPVWISDFDERTAPIFVFADVAEGGRCRATIEDDSLPSPTPLESAAGPFGHTLRLSYDVLKGGQFAGIYIPISEADTSDRYWLAFWIRGEDGGEVVKAGLMNEDGSEAKISVNDYLSAGITDRWQQARIPISHFGRSKSAVTRFSLAFENGRGPEDGVVFVDDVRFEKLAEPVAIDGFDDASGTNLFGVEHWSFAEGASAITPREAGGSLGISYKVEDDGAFAGWGTYLNDTDASMNMALALRIRGERGREDPDIYLDDGEHRDCIRLKDYIDTSTDWQQVYIPISEFVSLGIDASKLKKLEIAFEGRKMSGTIFVDDIQFAKMQ